jgi:hypothetical protein
MTSIWRKLAGLIPGITAMASPSATAADSDADQAWQEAYDARHQYYEKTVGAFPNDILKLAHMTGVWPGGGLFVLEANKLGKDTWVYSTFGLSNPDMPTSVTLNESKAEQDAQGRLTASESTLEKRAPATAPKGAAGYGFEFIVVTHEQADWPLYLLQWACNAEILNDVGFLQRADKYQGITVEKIQVGNDPGEQVNLLISRAQAPLPTGTQLPNGSMDILVATVITDEEMNWSIKNGRDALLARLQAAGVGQVSTRTRTSVAL